jgi:molybdate transport system substrate-binding protein
MPIPEFEGIARQIEASLKKAGGQALADAVADGSTILTHIHHRQTPLFLMQGRAEAGVTWQSEAMFQEQAGHPITYVDIPASLNTTAIFAGRARHPQRQPTSGFPSSAPHRRCRSLSATGSSLTPARHQPTEKRDFAA